MEGFINIHRCLLDSQVFASEKKLKVWVWLLLKACYKERFVNLKVGKGESTLKLSRGELLFGRFKAEEQLGFDGSSIYRIIKWFESEKMIEIKSNNQYTIITICKYDSYQSSEPQERTTNEQRMNSERTANEPDMNTYNKDKKDNKDKKKDNIKPVWKTDFDVYLQDLRKSFEEIQKDKEFISTQEKYYNNVDIIMSIHKSCVNFWSTEEGWKNKKSKSTKKIDWKATFAKSIDKNKVYKNDNR